MMGNHVLALNFNLALFNVFVKCSQPKAISLSSTGAPNRLSNLQEGL